MRAKELVIADACDALAARRTFVGINEHQIDVAGIVQLLAAMLSERKHGASDGTALLGAGLPEALADLAQGRIKGRLNGRIGKLRNVAGDLVERAIADDVVAADAQHLPLAETAENAEDRRVLVSGIDLGLQLRLQFVFAGTAPQRHPQHVEKIRIETEKIAKGLTGAEQMQKRFQNASVTLQKDGHLLDSGGIGKEAFEVVQCHVRIGTVRQQAPQWRAEITQDVQ